MNAAASSSSAPLLAVRAAEKRLAGRRVLDGASLTVGAYEVVAVLGANGAGKSTLLRALTGVLALDDGEVQIDGVSLGARRATALARVGYVPERLDAPEHLRGTEWLELIRALRRAPALTEATRAELGLDGFVRQRIGTFSLGQQRRLGLAGALLGSPPLLVLDEPTNGLDAEALATLARVLEAHRAGGGAVLVASHDRAFVERLGARVVVLEGGRLLAPPPVHPSQAEHAGG